MADSLPPFRYNNFLCSGPLVRDSARGYLTTDSRLYELLPIWRRLLSSAARCTVGSGKTASQLLQQFLELIASQKGARHHTSEPERAFGRELVLGSIR